MEYIPSPQSQAQHFILCCQCGTQIEPNLANMCVACLRSQVDITEGIPKQAILYFCKKCERYLHPPNTWISAQLESRELLSVCLKKLKGLSKVRLIDAGFVWTEPHSMRIKVKLTIQKETPTSPNIKLYIHLSWQYFLRPEDIDKRVMNGAILQQVFVVEYVVNSQMCDDCHRVEAKDFWRAVVQVRQKTDHKKTFYYLEQLILKHRAHVKTLNIKPEHDGLDFYYSKKDDAKKMVEFLQSVVPSRLQTAKELVSHDIHNNTFNYKHTFSVEIVPICKDSVVCLPPKVAQNLGSINPICVCSKVAQMIHFIDTNTLQIADMSGQTYWRAPFTQLCSPKQLTEYMVMQVDIVSEKDKPHKIPSSTKHILADLWVARMSDLGVNDQQYFCRTHLGHLLNAGDTVLGFDVANANLNHAEFEKVKVDKLPDVDAGETEVYITGWMQARQKCTLSNRVIVKKIFGDKALRNRRRRWKLKHLNDELYAKDTDSEQKDYNDFLEDLEEDATFRQNVNIYLDKNKIPVDTDDLDDSGAPQISLQEMLEDLDISTDATGEDGATMIE